jgi:hypothetical protein
MSNGAPEIATALRDLEDIARGRHRTPQDEMIWEFVKCQDWQQASQAVLRGLSAEAQSRHAVFLSPPPGWLPPLT